MKRKVNNKWYVYSEKGKKLGGPYNSEDEADKRLRQIEYFKRVKNEEKKYAKS